MPTVNNETPNLISMEVVTREDGIQIAKLRKLDRSRRTIRVQRTCRGGASAERVQTQVIGDLQPEVFFDIPADADEVCFSAH